MAFADLLKRYMKHSQLSDAELAKRIGGVTRETVYRWRTGTIKTPKYDKVIKSAEILDLTTQERSDFFMATGWPDPQAQVFKPQATVEENAEPVVGITTRPIIYARDFFGRGELLKRLANAWRRVPLEHVAIVGPERSGKTSLLNYIVDSHQKRRASKQQDSDWPTVVQNCVYVDLANKRMQRLDYFFHYVLNKLGLKKPVPCDLDIFIDTIDEQVTRPTLFLLDNVDSGLESSEMDEIFWDGMRSLSYGANGLLGFCVTSELTQKELKPLSGSNFLNLFEFNKLQAFTEEEARQFINAAPQSFSETETKWLLEQSHLWPVLLQELCKIRLDNEDWENAGKIKVQEYEFLWKSNT